MDCQWTVGEVRWPVKEAWWQSDKAGKPAQMKIILPREKPRPVLGEPLRMEDATACRFAGYVFSIEEGPTHREVLAYDQKRYLMFRDTILVQNKTADQLLSMLARDMGLQLGQVASTGAPLDLAIIDKKLLDVMEQALAMTQEKNGRQYILWDDGGALCLSEAGTLQSSILLRQQSALTDYRTGENIDQDTYNVIKLAQNNRKKGVRTICVSKDENSAGHWGRLQYYARVDEKKGEGEVRAQAQTLLKQKNRPMRSLTLHALGDTRCRAGFAIDWELDGQRDTGIISRALHHWKGAQYTMTLDVQSQDWQQKEEGE